MIITQNHPDAHRYLAVKGASRLARLSRLDTETREYTQVVIVGGLDLRVVTGVCDKIFHLPPGKNEWELING